MTRRRYSLVTRGLWSDARFLGLSRPEPNAQTLWLYLLTGEVQGPIPGLFRAGVGTLADGLAWDSGAVQELLQELERADLLQRSVHPPLVWLPRAIRHNPPGSPNVVKSWGSVYRELPETPLRETAMQEIRRLLRGEAFTRAFDSTFPDLGKASGKASRKGSPKASGDPSRKGSGRTLEGGSDPPASDGPGGGQGGLSLAVKASGKASGKASRNQEARSKSKKIKGRTEGDALAEVLREAIRTHTPRIAQRYDGPGKLLAWGRDLDRLVRLDKASSGEVRAVINFAHIGDKTHFWRPNLLSGLKVREHFDRLIIQARQGGVAIPSGTHDPTKEWMNEHHRWLLRWADEITALGKSRTKEALLEACSTDEIPTPPKPGALLHWLEDRT